MTAKDVMRNQGTTLPIHSTHPELPGMALQVVRNFTMMSGDRMTVGL